MPDNPVIVRFAPSPTGNVHIGNMRAAIFNWLFARHEGGKFLLRVEDTDRERSTPEAIQTLLAAMEWLGLDYDDEPLYQSSRCDAHKEAAQSLVADGNAVCAGAGEPTLLVISQKLFDPSFVTEPRDDAATDVSKGKLFATADQLEYVTTSKKSGESFVTPILWDALTDLTLLTADGSTRTGEELRDAAAGARVDAEELFGAAVTELRFKRRYVFFEDTVLGRMEKPLDSLRSLIIVRSDGSPVFHLANVLDDIHQGVTHILRGNDHVENTYRHLFIYKSLGVTPPAYGHFPMIVNAKGKPYSKRDGDAFVGDFQEKGYLPQCLFNFLALCGWGTGDDREIMNRDELTAAFTLERVSASASQMNIEKLEWMNGQYLSQMSVEELTPLIVAELKKNDIEAGELDSTWLTRLIEIQQEKMRTITEFVEASTYFFTDSVELQEKAVKKVLLKKEGSGLKILEGLRTVLGEVADWSEAALEAAILTHAESNELKMGDVAQPIRVAVTGGTVSRGIWETLFLIGRERTLQRIDHALTVA